MEISKLVTAENNVAVATILAISKQDAALKNAINALNELAHVNAVQFEDFGKKFGITSELLEEVRSLQGKLSKAKYGRY
jgi:hypothetical protein